MRTDGVHCRESVGTGPVVFKVVSVTGAIFSGHHGPINVRLSFPKPTGMCESLTANGIRTIPIQNSGYKRR